MAKVFIEETTLTAIGDAIRGKEGTTELIPVPDMATRISAIEGGGGGSEDYDDIFYITGDIRYKFSYNSWNDFLSKYKNKLYSSGVLNAGYLCYDSATLTEFPVALNFETDKTVVGVRSLESAFVRCIELERVANIDLGNNRSVSCKSLFENCNKLTEVGTIKNGTITDALKLFAGCYVLENLPTLENITFALATNSSTSMFMNCRCLLDFPSQYADALAEGFVQSYYAYHPLTSMFSSCYSLKTAYNLPLGAATTVAMTNSIMGGTFTNCYMLRHVTFRQYNDGRKVNWKSQTLTLDKAGFATSADTMYSSTKRTSADLINSTTAPDQETALAMMAANENWFTDDINYSSYNHDSAVETINSMPDTSAYLASAGGTNTIKFASAAGSAYGKGISTLTAEEIAVATAKGWTVTLS